MDANTPTNGNGNVASDRQQDIAGGPSANAVRHGLSAARHLPPELSAEVVQDIFEMLCRDSPPRSQFSSLALREVARHTAVLQTIEGGETAVQRLAAVGLASFANLPQEMGRDTALATAITAEPLDRISRYRKAHERALYLAIDKFHQLNERPGERRDSICGVPEEFRTVAACELSLAGRFTDSRWRCPACGKRQGSYSARAKRWNCIACGNYVGLRDGTIFAKSAIPLTKWFQSVAIISARLEIAPGVLAEELGLRRLSTVREMLKKIRQALDSGSLDFLIANGDLATLRPRRLRNETSTGK